MDRVEIIPVEDMGLIEKGDDLVGIILDRIARKGGEVHEDDIVTFASKVVSKAEGRIVSLSSVEPGPAARALAKVSGRDPRICELIIRHSRRVAGIIPTGRSALKFLDRIPESFPVGREVVERLFAREPTMILAEVGNGLIATDAGIDGSNIEGTENAILLPENADESCRRIREDFRARTGRTVAVVIKDTDVRFQRFGSVEQAIGSWGIETIAPHFGMPDLFGKPKLGGVDATTDMVAMAASLVMGNTSEAVPVAIVRGVRYRRMEKGMAPIQVEGHEVAKGVVYSIVADIRYYWHRLFV